LLEVGQPFRIGAAEDEVFLSYGVAYLYMKSPAFDLLDGGLDFFEGDVTGGAGDADAVAGFEIGREEEGLQGFSLLLPIRRKPICLVETWHYAADGKDGGKKIFSIHILKINRILFKESSEHGGIFGIVGGEF
jgi:hypothetical protein